MLSITVISNEEQDGYTQTVVVYGCTDCNGCEHRSRCLYKYNVEKNPNKEILCPKIRIIKEKRQSVGEFRP